LWTNINSDLFILWLAGRVIDGIVSRRQRRQQVILGVRGGTNYMMRIAADVLPEAYHWRLRDLENEIRWYGLTLDHQGKYLRAHERRRAETAKAEATEILSAAKNYLAFKRESERLWDQTSREFQRANRVEGIKQYRHELTMVSSTRDHFRQYLEDPTSEPGPTLVAAREARNEVGSIQIPRTLKDSLFGYLTAVENSIEESELIKERVSRFVQNVRDTEIIYLDRTQF
jgi:hypothetical protein